MLELQNVGIGYGRHQVVTGVDLSLAPGRTVGLVGESGSGKSTVARAIVGLLPLREGTIRLDGAAIAESGTRVRKSSGLGIQMVFQDPRNSLNPRMRMGDMLLESARLHRSGDTDPKERVGQLVSTIGLTEEHLDRFPHQLSGGQLQRFAIARSLAAGAKHLVLDEVTASLDVSVQARILNLLRSLQRELGFSMLYISHDLSVVRYLSDHVYVMKSGSIVEAGDVDHVFHRPATDYTRLLLDSVPELDGARWR